MRKLKSEVVAQSQNTRVAKLLRLGFNSGVSYPAKRIKKYVGIWYCLLNNVSNRVITCTLVFWTHSSIV